MALLLWPHIMKCNTMEFRRMEDRGAWMMVNWGTECPECGDT
jgi:hypothetical protein